MTVAKAEAAQEDWAQEEAACLTVSYIRRIT